MLEKRTLSLGKSKKKQHRGFNMTKIYCKNCLYFLSSYEQHYIPAEDACCTRPEIKTISYRTPTHKMPADTEDGLTIIKQTYLAFCKKRNAKNNCRYFKKKTIWNKLFGDKDFASPDDHKIGY